MSSKTDYLFTPIAPERSGIDFENTLKSTPELNILNYIYYYNGGGVATADFNGDGLQDLYFTANQGPDKIYLNLGGLKFKDITTASGASNATGWTTGVTVADVNHDGRIDIYVSKVAAHSDPAAHNLLFINQGNDPQGQPIFQEQAAQFNLDFKGFGTQAAFFDYDLDGDLDCFLLNHATNPNQNYGRGSARNTPHPTSGDKLLENRNGVFTNVSEASGIFQSKIGYGLGVSVSDLNQDGYPDLYVSNDFFENDYLYLNNGDKTFKELITSDPDQLGHSTHFSMGNDIGDLNNDGLPDIISLDMLPENLETYKTAGAEFNYQIYSNYIKNGYAHQFMQNSLQWNNGNNSFSETGQLSGIAATEWSWSPLIADLDNDGWNDIYITNGILGATNDMDFINFIANETIQQSLNEGMDESDMAFIDKIPKKHVPNYFFQNNKNNTFRNTKEDWHQPTPSYSHGAVYADLDNDGDLDLVTNNVNAPAFIYENRSNTAFPERSFVRITLKGDSLNPFGIGTKAMLYTNGHFQQKELFTTKGYLSAIAPQLHFGWESSNAADSLTIVWPDGSFETMKNVPKNERLHFQKSNAAGNFYSSTGTKTPSFLKAVPAPIPFRHQENQTLDFNRDPLIPFAMSNEGPSISVADVNNDQRQDMFVSGAKNQASQLWIQTPTGSFMQQQEDMFQKDSKSEDVAHVFFDATGNGFNDLLVVSAGNEFLNGEAIQPRLYRNESGRFIKDTLNFRGVQIHASDIAAIDVDLDGDLDIAISASLTPHQFGHTPKQYLFENDGKGRFTDVTSTWAPEWQTIGNVTNMTWVDLDGNGWMDLIAVGDWMPVTVFLNDGNRLTRQQTKGFEKTHGWWNRIVAEDFDGDGDVDLVAGNWGLNTRLTASASEPITLYRNDFDDNKNVETIVTHHYRGKETTFASKDELVKQIPVLNKTFLSYRDFAKAEIQELFPKKLWEDSYQKKAYELATCYFENTGNGTFKKHLLPFKAQISSVNDIWVEDVNNDGFPDLLLVGNNFEISTQLSRLDASHGLLMLNNGSGQFSEAKNTTFNIPGAARHIQELTIAGDTYLVISRNNDSLLFLKKIEE
ncbi:VCBS repeat-containing protein [Altibacter sp. HG106]|uniref:VCBS repeat-containing protein n=1 Tax=Altibacter sp. HG106 TaxID=3023937 RepID=UPI002350B7C2|nr:VCBS repeat-containing protein [Altibacter sp. HG106]MDC7994256.1 VCBS repeat-containing protein [Altibacter sp. HG106]